MLITACFEGRRCFHISENGQIAARGTILRGVKPREADIPLTRQAANKSDLCSGVRHTKPKDSANAYFLKTVDFLGDIEYNRSNISAKEERQWEYTLILTIWIFR